MKLLSPINVTPTYAGAAGWHDVDVSAHVGSDAGAVIGVQLFIVNTSGATRQCQVRKNGSSDALASLLNNYNNSWRNVFIGTDANDVFEIYMNGTGLTVYLTGYWTTTDDAVFLTNKVEVTPTYVSDGWHDVDIASETGSDTAIAAILYHEIGTTQDDYMTRENGSTDNRFSGEMDDDGWHGGIQSVDANEIFEVYFAGSHTQRQWLVGWINSGATFFTNAVNFGAAGTSGYGDETLSSIPSGVASYAFLRPQNVNARGYYVRREGDPVDLYVSTTLLNEWADIVVPIDPVARAVEHQSTDTQVQLYLQGYGVISEPQPGGTIEFLQSATDTADQAAYTFASQNLGAASFDRHIIVTAVARKAGAAFALSSVTIGGVAATIVRQVTNTITNSDTAAIVIAKVPSGTTGDIVVTWDTTVLRCAIGVYRATGLDDLTEYDDDASTAADPTVTLDVPKNGFAIGAALTGAATSCAWTGLTEDADSTLESFVTYSWAHTSIVQGEAGRTMTADFGSSTESAGVFASWQFAPRRIGHVSRVDTGSAAAVASRATAAQAHTHGNLLVVLVSRQSTEDVTVTDTAGNTYTLAHEFTESGNPNHLSIFYAYNIFGHAANVVTATLASGTGAYFMLSVREFKGFGLVDPLIDFDNGDGNGTAVAAPSLSLSGQEAVIVAEIEADNQGITAGTGFTSNVNSVTTHFADAFKVIEASEAATANCTSGDWRIIAALFKGLSPAVDVNDSRDAEIFGATPANSARDAEIEGQVGWQIQRQLNGGGFSDIETAFIIEEAGGLFLYDDTSGFSNGDEYCYRVRRYSTQYTFPWSNTDCVTFSAGGTPANSSRAAEIVGFIAVSSVRDAEIHGVATANDARDAEITGQASANSARDAEIHGQTSANDSRDAEVTGSQADDDARDAEIHGSATANDSRDAEIYGVDTDNDSRDAEIEGVASANDARDAEIHGTADANDSRDAEITGSQADDDSRDAEVHGVATANDTRDAEITGSQDDDDARAAEVTGAQGANASRDAEIHGVATENNSRDAEIHGTADTDDSRDAEITGSIAVNASRDAEVHGVDTENDSRDAEVTGAIAVNDSRDAQIEGVATTPSSRDAEIHGQASDSDNRAAEVTGSQAVNSSRDAEVHGVTTATSARPAEIEGDTASDDNRAAEIHGTADDDDARAAEITGSIAANSSRAAEMHGEDETDDSRNAEITGAEGADDDRSAEISGSQALDDDRSAEVHGTADEDDSRGAEVFGAITVDAARDAEIQGVEIGISYRGATVWGFIPQIGIQLGKNKNTGLKVGTVVKEVGLNKNTGTKMGVSLLSTKH